MSFEHRIQRLMSGQAKGPLPSLGRLALGAMEPVYRLALDLRNRRFDRDASAIRRLPRPVVSVGNLTTGGTGKTPVIRWLAAALRGRGMYVAILARGYKAAPGTLGDEQRMLLAMLSGDGGGEAGGDARIPWIECDPDRHAAGLRALARQPGIDVFLLDDGFQHRRLHRDLDIVLLHAPAPFGYGHLLPRGLLREPIAGLKRAGAVILTSADAASAESRAATIAEVRRHHPDVPIALERHEPSGLRSPAASSVQTCDVSLAMLGEQSVFCFSGLGSPGGFERQVQSLARTFTGARRFADHHAYTAADVQKLQSLAVAAGASVLVTTEKDWVKLADLPAVATTPIPIWRLDIEARLDDQTTVLDAVLRCAGGRG